MIDPETAYFSQQLVNGLTLGAVYGLIALGYSMVYGILGLINFAHGELYMMGGYLAFLGVLAATALGVEAPILLLLGGLGLAMLSTGASGVLLERVCYRPLRRAPKLAPFITAIGASIFLQNAVQVAQGTRPRALGTLFEAQHTLAEGVSITTVQLIIMGVSAVLLTGFAVLIRCTAFGRQQRAIQQDAGMAAMLGIGVDRVISSTFAIGAMLAGVAGTCTLLYYGVVDFTMGFLAGIKAFSAAVLGGIGSLPGAVLGGLILGLSETFWAAYVSADYKHAVGFVVLIMVLLLRPQGLFGRPEFEKV